MTKSSKRTCSVCGEPANGFASIYYRGVEHWYCHPDDGPSCYVSASILAAARDAS